ncbi:hypothetical protein [Lysobacter sp. HA35]
MKHRLTLLLCAALAASSAHAAVTPLPAMEEPILVTRVDCRIVIDKQGNVAEYVPKTELPAPVAARVADLVKALRFEPVEVDGRVVNAETTMRVAVSAKMLDDGGMRLAIDNLTFPPEKPTSPGAPSTAYSKRISIHFPEEALRLGLDADVLVALRLGADGHVLDAAAQQSALVHQRGNPREVAKALAIFERAALASLRGWQANPASLQDKDRVGDGYVTYMPVQFRTASQGQKPSFDGVGQWTLETRTVKRVPAWVPVTATAPQPGASDLADGEQSGINTRYRLVAPLATLAP